MKFWLRKRAQNVKKRIKTCPKIESKNLTCLSYLIHSQHPCPWSISCSLHSLFDVVRSHRGKIQKLIPIFPNTCNLLSCNLLPNVCRQIVKWLFVTAFVNVLLFSCRVNTIVFKLFGGYESHPKLGRIYSFKMKSIRNRQLQIRQTTFCVFPAQIKKKEKHRLFHPLLTIKYFQDKIKISRPDPETCI